MNMQYDILLTKTTSNGYTARPLLWPEIVGSGANEAEAIAQVRNALASALNQSRLVQIELPAPEEADDPWLRAAGMWKDIPEDKWSSFQDELAIPHAIAQDNLNYVLAPGQSRT